MSDARPVDRYRIGAQLTGIPGCERWNGNRKVDSTMPSTPFTGRHVSSSPFVEMPTLRVERAPLRTPEYRGLSPRAALHRRQAQQTMLLALYEISVRGSGQTSTESTDATDLYREPPIWRWSLGSLVLMVVIVAICVATTFR